MNLSIDAIAIVEKKLDLLAIRGMFNLYVKKQKYIVTFLKWIFTKAERRYVLE